MKQTPISLLPLAAGIVATCAAFGSCDLDESGPAEAAGGGGSGATTTTVDGGGGVGGAGGAGGGLGGGGGDTPPLTRRTISGDVTWTATFDDVAKAAGATDCFYTRRYQGVENASSPWFCPGCEVVFEADVEMVEGLTDCYSQVSASQPSETEYLGYGNGVWYRGFGGPMTDQGTAAVDGDKVQWANTVADFEPPVGGTLAFAVSGELTIGEQDGDPMHGWTAPDSYQCGWPSSGAPTYAGDNLLVEGGILPDGLFLDVCEEPVRLHDFAGDYILIDMSAGDCPPCQQWASLEDDFVATMAGHGILVHVITLLAPSLSDTLGETTTQMIDAWMTTYEVGSPVLADRGWGLSMFEPVLGDEVGYPSWLLVDPDLRIISWGSGFGEFGPFEAAILADAE